MLKDDLMMLRKLNGYSQEQIAERSGISRQAYAKWENGSTVPDIEKAAVLAKVYGITLDRLLQTEPTDGGAVISTAPDGKNIWGTATIGECGQIFIPKAARDKFGLRYGDRMIVVSDNNGIALLPTEFFERIIRKKTEQM